MIRFIAFLSVIALFFATSTAVQASETTNIPRLCSIATSLSAYPRMQHSAFDRVLSSFGPFCPPALARTPFSITKQRRRLLSICPDGSEPRSVAWGDAVPRGVMMECKIGNIWKLLPAN